MKRASFLLIVFLFLVTAYPANGATLGDINADSSVGLPEAVYALQVTSGIRPQSTTGDPYDFSEYFFVENGRYIYDYANYPGTTGGTVQNTCQTYDVSRETFNGNDAMAVIFNMTSKSYYAIGSQYINYLGYYNPGNITAPTAVMIQPYIIGARAMEPGAVYAFGSQSSASPASLDIRETVFLGLEDVTVPAGIFTNCLKMLTRTSNFTYLDYYAKGVGMVKRYVAMTASSSGSTMALMSARVGGANYPNGSTYYLGQGTWNKTVGGESVQTGSFAMPFTLPAPTSSPLYLNGFLNNNLPLIVPLSSQDGVNFTGTATPASLTVQGNTITGTVTYTSDVTYIVQIAGTYSPAP